VFRQPRSRRALPLGLFAAAVFALPLALHSPYALSTLTLIGLYTIVTLGLCLLMGYAGQASLGQAAFVGLGAYGSAILTRAFGLPGWLALLCACALTAAVAWLVGIPVLKLRGHYLAMGTLALGVIVNIGLREWRSVTGGPSGLAGIPHFALGPLTIKGDLQYYYLVWALVCVFLLISLNVVDSRFGRALRAIRASESAAESLGVDLGRIKLAVFVLAAMYASISGSLYAHYMTFISPGPFDLDSSVQFVLMAAVGGLASIWGAPFGTATVVLLALAIRELALAIVPQAGGEYQAVVYGVLLVLIMIFLPEGVTVSGMRYVRGRLARGLWVQKVRRGGRGL
jgi:branched-chain amino acid transport system permease protein